MGELGVLGMTIPEEYGGSGFNAASYCRMTETVAPLDASASIVIGAHLSIGCKPVVLFGSEEQKKKWLPDLATGKLVAAFCLTEPEAGSDAGSLKTTADVRRRDGHLRPERDQTVDLERRVRDVLLGLRARPLGRRRTATRRSAASRSSRIPTARSPASRAAPRRRSSASARPRPARSSSRTAGSRPRTSSARRATDSRYALETLNTGRTSLGAGSVGGSKMDDQARGRPRDAAQAVQAARSPTSR